MGGKWLELLKEMAPRVNRAAMIFNPDTAPGAWHTAASAIRRASMSRSIVELFGAILAKRRPRRKQQRNGGARQKSTA
jgi:hypothetical protein